MKNRDLQNIGRDGTPCCSPTLGCTGLGETTSWRGFRAGFGRAGLFTETQRLCTHLGRLGTGSPTREGEIVTWGGDGAVRATALKEEDDGARRSLPDSRECRSHGRVFVLLLLCLFVVTRGAFAAGSDTVIIPYDSKKPLSEQHPDQVYLPYEQFLNLWQAAKENRRESPAETLDVPFALTSAHYRGKIGERAAEFTGTLDLLIGGADSWRDVPLDFRDVKLTSVTLDGAPASLKDGKLIVEKPGRHRLDVSFEIPLKPGQAEVEWGIPPTAATLVTLQLPESRNATITPGAGSVETVAAGTREITAALGTTSSVHFTLASSASNGVRNSEPASAAIHANTELSVAAQETDAEIVFAFPGAQQNRFTVSFDAGFELSSLSAPDIQSWKLHPEGERQSLDIVLHQPVRDQFTINLGVLRAIASLPADGTAPSFSATAHRVEMSYAALLTAHGLQVTAKPSATQRQTSLDYDIPDGWNAMAAYTGPGPLGWHLAAAPAHREARVDYLYQVTRRQIELFASMQLFSMGDDLSTAAFDLPPGYTVQTVHSERLQDWWREGDRLRVRFRGDTPEKTVLVLYLVHLEPAAPAALEVKPLGLEGFAKVTGDAIVAAFKGVDVAMKLSGSAREIAPETASSDYQVLAPIERKRGLNFTAADFSAQVTLTPAPAKMQIVWATDAEAHEAWLSLSTKIRATLRQGSTDVVRFTLPADLPEARVTGDDVREVRTRVEGGNRLYEVQFQKEIYSEEEFTAELDLPGASGMVPAITFPDAQRTTGYVLVDNASEGEMTVESAGVDPAPENEVPWLPQLSRSARIFRVQPRWSVKVTVEHFEKAASRSAFCAWADFTTALRPDGTEWMRAVWHLQNRTLQFLPVHLPDGVELASVRVAGQAVRADTGNVYNKSVILVPLIKTKPGELSYDVEIVYRAEAARFGRWATRKLADPELVGITVERTFWNVWLPPGWNYRNADGNMEPVIEEVAATEKLDDALQELKKLGSIVSSVNVKSSVRQEALGNFNKLAQELETSNAPVPQDRALVTEESKGKAAVGKDARRTQTSYVARKRKDVAEQLQSAKQEIEQLSKEKGEKVNLPSTASAPPEQWAVETKNSNSFDANRVRVNAAQLATANAEVKRWKENGAAKGNAVTTPPSSNANASGGNRLYLSDNIVLQQQQKEPAPQEPKLEPVKPVAITTPSSPPPPAGAPATMKAMPYRPPGVIERGRDPMVERELAWNIPGDGLKSELGRQNAGQQVMTQNGSATIFNTARGNIIAREEHQHNVQLQEKIAMMQVMTQDGVDQKTVGGIVGAPDAAAAMAQKPGMEPNQSATGLDARDKSQSILTLNNKSQSFFDSGRFDLAKKSATQVLALDPNNSEARKLSEAIDQKAADYAALGYDNTRAYGLWQTATPEPPAKQSGLKPEGRLSLAVDFPTEGEVLHFKKVKANPSLKISLVQQGIFRRWENLGIFGVLGMLLWLVERKFTAGKSREAGA